MKLPTNSLRKSMANIVATMRLLNLLKINHTALKKELKLMNTLTQEELDRIVELTKQEFAIHEQRRNLLSNAIDKEFALELHELQHQLLQTKLNPVKRKSKKKKKNNFF